MLKDNADDIKEKIEHYRGISSIIQHIINECNAELPNKYSSAKNLTKPDAFFEL